MNLKQLIKKYGQTYSSLLKINLNSKKESEIFKWFLASLLFGKPIQENVAIRTIRLFLKKKIDSPNKILKIGWHGLVKILDDGGYARYDFSTATKLLSIMKKLNRDYKGKVTAICKIAKDSKDLEKRLLAFNGVGPVTVNIFLRELTNIWPKANPEPSPLIKKTAKRYKLNLNKLRRNSKTFIKLECALHRLSKKKKKWD